jgi:transcriptional regulator with XRE-family HTH domain
MDTPGKRITKWRESLGLKATKFAEATGIPYTTLKTIESDSNKPSYDVLVKLRNTYPELNIDWIFDEGDTEPMLREDRSLRRAEPRTQEQQPALAAEANTDEYYHRYQALLDMVKTGFFGSPEQLLRKKANASSGAASLFETVDEIAAAYPLYTEPGFKQAGRQLRFA